ncbi:MAG: helix-turn-helix transcriptional regulator [Hyphomonadaceae bacterium]|nr:helix-turn-helix transcriptional regulator [Hyphomonadaceae bacterium]
MTQFADALKSWRKARRYSQLELAHEAEVSSRHLSFLETGRANPSREMIQRLGDALDLPLAIRNQLLAQAGFAARYPQRDWSSDEMAPIREAVEYTLRQHAPYPALAVDRHWTILQMNMPAKKLLGLIGARVGISLLDLMLEESVQAMIENWPEVAHHTAQRLRVESASRGGDRRLDAAIEALSLVRAPDAAPVDPVIPTIYRAGDLRLSLFTTIAQFGTPEDLALDDLKIELFFPSDAETAATLGALAQAPDELASPS